MLCRNCSKSVKTKSQFSTFHSLHFLYAWAVKERWFLSDSQTKSFVVVVWNHQKLLRNVWRTFLKWSWQQIAVLLFKSMIIYREIIACNFFSKQFVTVRKLAWSYVIWLLYGEQKISKSYAGSSKSNCRASLRVESTGASEQSADSTPSNFLDWNKMIWCALHSTKLEVSRPPVFRFEPFVWVSQHIPSMSGACWAHSYVERLLPLHC